MKKTKQKKPAKPAKKPEKEWQTLAYDHDGAYAYLQLYIEGVCKVVISSVFENHRGRKFRIEQDVWDKMSVARRNDLVARIEAYLAGFKSAKTRYNDDYYDYAGF